MAYDIPDEIKYREKIVAGLDLKQLGYSVLFGLIAYFSYKFIPLEGDLKLIFPGMTAIVGICFVFLNMENRALEVLAYVFNLKKASHKSKTAQKFFEVKKIEKNIMHLDNGKVLAIIKVEPINFGLLDDDRKKALLENYRSFLNHLSVPIQILIRTEPLRALDYFEKFQHNKRGDIIELYSDFRSFQEDFIEKYTVRKRNFYIIASFLKNSDEIEETMNIMHEKLNYCSLMNRRLNDEELLSFLLSYSSLGGSEIEETKMKKDEISNDLLRSVITPSFDIRKDYAMVNGEYHRVVRVNGYPRKVEDGWLQSFLSKNEGYDITVHVEPSTIRHMLVYLHNQIIQQTSDLMMSTMKGTPNPALEIKKADTMRVYDHLYKGEEKLFYVSTYIDNKDEDLKSLNLLTEKCKANLNSMMMIPNSVNWKTADAIKSTMPLAADKLETKREFLTSSLAATFPFISPVDSRDSGILFAHDIETMNPIFLDFESMSNKHFFVIGISGSGKSYTSKYLLLQQLFKEETKCYVLDPNGEYSGLCRSLGGQTVDLSRTSKSIINLFDLAGDDFGNKLLSLISAFDILVGGLTESQKSILNKALFICYKKAGICYDDPTTWDMKCPTFSDLKKALKEIREAMAENKEYLQDPSVQSLINRVEMYCKGGIFGFMDQETKLEVENNFSCFDLSGLPGAVKPLCMFIVLDLIRKEIKKDIKAKMVLIDEGWALLKSKEAENYLLEFIKTSRKYNTAIGFITQEIEDLLNSQTGTSILNTASTKILTRQNPSNIRRITGILNLNKHMENYLLTAPRGQGLVITERGSYKFSITSSPKLHKLLTTNPKDLESYKQEKPKENEEVKKKYERGLYLKNELNQAEIVELVREGYIECRERLSQNGGSSAYMVKRRGNESSEHAFLLWSTYYLLKEKYKKVKIPASVGPDIIVESDSKKACFEIETGSTLERFGFDKLKDKFERLGREFDQVYIVVSSKTQRARYSNFAVTITRNEIADLIQKLPI